MDGWQKPAAPQSAEKRLIVAVARALRNQHDVRGHTAVFAAQSIGKPRADARASRLLRTCLDEGHGGVVIDGFRVDGFHDADVVGNACGMRQQFAEPSSVLAVLGKLEHGRDAGEILLSTRHARNALAVSDGCGQFLAVMVFQFGLVVEQINVRRPAGLKQVDHALGLGRKVQKRHRPAALRGKIGTCARKSLGGNQRS